MVNGHLCKYTKNGTMQVYYKTIYGNPFDYKSPGLKLIKDKWNVHQYKLLHIEFCCKTMAEAFGHPIPTMDRYGRTCPIDFGEMHDPEYILNKSNHVTICDISTYPENTVYNFVPITYCPFCGGKIKCIEEEKVKQIGEPYQETITKYKSVEVPFD